MLAERLAPPPQRAQTKEQCAQDPPVPACLWRPRRERARRAAQLRVLTEEHCAAAWPEKPACDAFKKPPNHGLQTAQKMGHKSGIKATTTLTSCEGMSLRDALSGQEGRRQAFWKQAWGPPTGTEGPSRGSAQSLPHTAPCSWQ